MNLSANLFKNKAKIYIILGIGLILSSIWIESHFISYFMIALWIYSLYDNGFQLGKYHQVSIAAWIGILGYNLLFSQNLLLSEIQYFSVLLFFPFINWKMIPIEPILFSGLFGLFVVNTINYIYFFQVFSSGQDINILTISNALFTDRPYNSLFILVFSYLTIHYLLNNVVHRFLKSLIVISIVYIHLFFFLFSVRIILIALPILWITLLIINSKIIRLTKYHVFIFTSILITTVVFINKNQYFTHMISMAKNIDDPRVSIWTCAGEQIKNSWLLGSKENTTKATLQQAFKRYYDEGHPWLWIYRDGFKFDCHNQFIEVFLRYGVVYFIAFLFTLLGLFKKTILEKKTYLFISLLIFTLFFMIESILQRQRGIFLFLFIIYYFLNHSYEKSKQD